MTVGGRAVGNVQIAGHANRGTLNAVQGDALLHAILKDDHFARGSGTTRWVVSTAGANAVLPPLPVPLVHAADVLGKSPLARPFAPADLPDLRTALRAAVKGADCDLLDSQAPGDAKIDAWQLQTARLLVSHRCWSGAYNSGDGYRVIARRPPYAPVFVTDAATGYENGEVTSSEQGPGIGDCWATASCTWDGKSFVQTHMANSGMCREIAAGGAWTMPTLVMRLDKRR